MLDNARVILVEPTHPGNIGAAARAMKTMGLQQLYIVKPKCFPHQSATRMAAGADDILQQACVVDDLPQALAGVVLAYATSARRRSLEWPLCTPRECAERAMVELHSPVAFVFGREHAGLTNDELALCHAHVHINTDDSFSSLNLAAAVQVLSYELRMAYLNFVPKELSQELDVPTDGESLANASEVMSFMQHLELLLINLKVLDPSHPKLLMRRLRRLFYRARLKKNEINILRGIFKAIENN